MNFTNVSKFSCEAIGEPGNRTFRILVTSRDGSATIWLEKEQLLQLALAMEQVLLNTADMKDDHEVNTQIEDNDDIPRGTHLEFNIDKLAIGSDDLTDQLVIEARAEETGTELRILVDRAVVKMFVREAIKVCEAGRPLCHLCGVPIDKSGHVCPRTNGHHLADFGANQSPE